MNEFIKQNRQLLKFYRLAARIFGWTLICGGIVWFLTFIFWILAYKDAAGDLVHLLLPTLCANTVYAITSFSNDFALPGLIALGLAQWLQFILQPDDKGGWMLRHGHWILYGFAIVIMGEVTLKITLMPETRDPDSVGLVFVSPLLVPTLAKVLVVVGLGVVLKRMIAIIDESKTLV
ncbi:MAG: hypothetical protein ACYTEK_03980 [Planctomycetota bacterium]|jgi:hypothetical protein